MHRQATVIPAKRENHAMTTRRRDILVGLAALPLASLLPRSAFAQAPLAGDIVASSAGDITLHPVNHASLVIAWGDQVVYVDPVGGAARFAGLPAPTAILVTHAHGDHYDPVTLRALAGDGVSILASQQVFGQLAADIKAKAAGAANGETVNFAGIKVDVIAAYNTTPERSNYHPKGVGNGYVLNIGDMRIYVAGDTEDIPEMRALKDIAVAFLPMNLPYTMDMSQAADAIKEFRPKIVYPYHYQGMKIEDLPGLVGDAAEVRLRDWYA